MQKGVIKIGVLLTLLVILSLGGGIILAHTYQVSERIANDKVTTLEQEVAALSAQVKVAPSIPSTGGTPIASSRSTLAQTQKTASLTEVVAKAGPSVVSVIIYKEVPQLEVTYENPFGN